MLIPNLYLFLMKKILVPIFFLSIPLMLFAQSQQQVVVREYKEKAQKTPLEGVSLSVQNAGSSLSDAEGQLTLQFRTLKAGDPVQVRRVDLSGYEIFNRDAVEQWTISPQNTFNLVLCRSDRFKQLRDAYMLVSSSSYAKQYKKDQARLEALRKENKLQEEAYQKQLVELENNYYEQLDNLENYVDRFARIDLSELSSQEQNLIYLVQEGKIDEAIALYESADYLSRYNTQVKDIQEINRAQTALSKVEAEKLEARDKVQAAITRQVQTYQLAGGRENYSKITALLKGVADADTTNKKAVWTYSEHCLKQNIFSECEKYFNIFLRQSIDNKKEQALACLRLGSMFFSKFEFDLAEKYEQQALSIANDCISEDREQFLPLLTNIQCELHTLYNFTQRPEKLLSFTEKLREQIEYLLPNDPDLWTRRLATLYGEQGFAYFLAENDAEKAESLMLKYYEMSKLAVEKDSLSENVIQLVDAISHLSQLYYMTNQWIKMENYLLEELSIHEENYQKNADANIRYVFSAYSNLTELYLNLNKFDSSHEYLVKAEKMIPDMLKLFDESTLEYDKMNLYDAASQLYHKEGNIEQTRLYARQCLDSFQKIPEDLKEGLAELVLRNEEYLK